MSKTNGAKTVEIEPIQEITEKKPRGLVKILKGLLADESVLYAKLRNYHWNVTGVNFYPLHTAFEAQFNEIADMADDLAEHIRQYGANAPGTMEEFIQKAHLRETPGIYPDAQTMVANLVSDHEAMIGFLSDGIESIGEKSADVGVIDLLTSLLQQHQKMTWMLRMCLES